MPDTRPDGISAAEWEAIQAHRRDSAPKRRATLRGTDAESGNEWELELTAEEAAQLAGRTIGKLFGAGDDDGKDAKDDGGKKPAVLRDYFGPKKQAG